MKTSIFFLLVSVLILLGGCAKRTDDSCTNIQVVTTQLATSADSVNNSLQELAKIQRAVYPALKLPAPPNARKINMGQLITVNWVGPIEPLVRDAARVTNYYRFRVLGRAPAIPVLVSVHYGQDNPATVADVLRDAAYQCGDKVDIVAYPRRRVIELRYRRE